MRKKPLACENANNYRGLKKPTCLNGDPCHACLTTYSLMKQKRARRAKNKVARKSRKENR